MSGLSLAHAPDEGGRLSTVPDKVLDKSIFWILTSQTDIPKDEAVAKTLSTRNFPRCVEVSVAYLLCQTGLSGVSTDTKLGGPRWCYAVVRKERPISKPKDAIRSCHPTEDQQQGKDQPQIPSFWGVSAPGEIGNGDG